MKELAVDGEHAAVRHRPRRARDNAAGANDWPRSDARGGPRSISPAGRAAARRGRPARPRDKARRGCRSRRRHGLRADARRTGARPSMRARLSRFQCGTLAAPYSSSMSRAHRSGRWRRASPAARRNGGRWRDRASTTACAACERRVDVAIAFAHDGGLGRMAGRRIRPAAPSASSSAGSSSMSTRDQVGGVLGEIGIGREHHRDRLADIAHAIAWRGSAGDRARALRCGVRRKSIGGMSATSAAVQTATTPGRRARRWRIDRDDAAVRVRGAHHAHVQLMRKRRHRPQSGRCPVTSGRSSSRGTERPTKPIAPSQSLCRRQYYWAVRQRVEVMGFVDAADANATAADVDLVEAARLLRDAPVGRQRLSRTAATRARFTLSWPTSTIVSSGWRASTKRKALAARAARSCSDSPLGNGRDAGVANHAAKSADRRVFAVVESFELPGRHSRCR